jgi:hypothetical protein
MLNLFVRYFFGMVRLCVSGFWQGCPAVVPRSTPDCGEQSGLGTVAKHHSPWRSVMESLPALQR